jgi:glycosyltransferase involved in cell wall biosynthesis
VTAPRFSLVIPAHNEASVILRTLLSFMPDLLPGEAEVIVVANGCTDDTVERARSVPGVDVLDIAAASKAAALNAGDERATAFPRIYVDADIVLDAAALRETAEALTGSTARVAAPRVNFITNGRPVAVRAFFAVYTRLPYANNGLTGLGVYGISEAGRARFEQFPAITADDLFIQRLFSRAERLVVTSSFDVQTPKTLRSLVRVRTRTAFGNEQLATTATPAFAASTKETAAALLTIMRREPKLILAVGVYVGVTIVARLSAKRRSASRWQRDDSTR